MKKLFSTILIILSVCISTAIPSYASNSNTLVGSGYTNEGIYFEVYCINDETFLSRAASITVTREIIYEGIISPPAQLDWNETISGINYSGTLKIQSFRYSNEKTIATYKGILVSQ